MLHPLVGAVAECAHPEDDHLAELRVQGGSWEGRAQGQVAVGDLGRQITTTLLLALDATDQDPHGPLARTALRIAACLDPDGQPAALWTTTALCTHLTQQQQPTTAPPRRTLTLRRRPRNPAQAVTSDQALAALRLLDRYGLITYDSTENLRTVRIHALTARALHETTPENQRSAAATTAADALAEIWPNPDHTQRELAAVLRANTDTLTTHAADSLWKPDAHLVLYRAGTSLLNAHLHSTASTYWTRLATDCEQVLGDEHPDTLTSRANLATSYQQAGRTNDAITLLEHVLTDRERLLGNEHPHTLTTRANLATSYQQAGRTNDAINLLEHVLTDSERILGNEHPDTRSARDVLSRWRSAGG
ncbi:tetratricopeptide repeat protein [Streptomyces sp. NPDC002559]